MNLIEQYGEIYFGLYGNLEWEEFLSGDSEEVSADIPDGAVKYKGHYYYVFDLEDLSLIGAEAFAWAEEYCESLGGHLATITSAEEDSFVFQAMKNQGYSNAYFGFTDEAEEGTWVWVTGEEVSYTNWSSGEPNNEAGKEDYAMYYYRNTTGMWNDGGFNTSTVSGGHAFICEWDTGDTTTTASDTLCLRRGNTFYINYTLEGGNADLTFTYGRASDEVLIGDWDGDGIDTICVRRGNRFYFSNTLGGEADFYIDFGRTSDEVVAGDWDGDGCDTICVRRGNHYYINNTLESGNAAIDFTFGRIDDEVLSGDWDGDGYDTLCIRRGITYYINNTLEGGNAAIHFTFGRTSDSVLSGDWDGDGCDTLCIRRGNHYYINNTLEGGNAAIDFTYGRTGDEVYAGVWYDGTMDVSLYFETYEYLVDVLGMTRTISWQFLSDDSYEADGFYLEWLYDTFSMKNEGAKNVSLYGIGIGSDVSEAAATLKNEGYEVSDE
ncbi:MAG: hypothetical protein LIP11_09170 [Clostridiales bacterium]|nr:hypothetical protein [Clostridiales bacterium]